MKRLLSVFLCLGVVLLVGAGTSFALMVDFNDAYNGEVLDSKYAPSLYLASIQNTESAVTTLPVDTGTDVRAVVAGDSVAVSGDNFQGLLLTFNDLMSSVTITGYDWGGDYTRDNETMYLSAFDEFGNFLGSDSFAGPFASPNTRVGTLAFDGIKHIAFTFGNTTLGFYGIDSVDATEMTTQVPEPATMLLLGTGLIGLAVSRRKLLSKK